MCQKYATPQNVHGQVILWSVLEKKLTRATDTPILTLYEKHQNKSIVSQLLSAIIGKTTLDFTIFLEQKVVTVAMCGKSRSTRGVKVHVNAF